MNPPPHSYDPAVDEEAALWAARLDGAELTAADRAALDRWLAGDPARRAALSSYCQFSADLEQLLPTVTGMREQAAEISPALRGARPSPWLRRSLLTGAALTAAAALVLVFLRPDPDPAPRSVATAVAQRQDLALPDGSRVELNAQSALVIEFGRAERRVRLASGQAFFSVTRDPARPFVVETPMGSVRVTGTAFDVRTDAGTTLDVTVAEGTVAVRPADHAAETFQLLAGDRLSAGPNGVALRALTAAELSQALAWRDGYVVFARVPLRDALASFARYHGREITVAPGIADIRIGGRFSLDDLEGFFAGLEAGFPVRVHRDPAAAIRVTARP